MSRLLKKSKLTVLKRDIRKRIHDIESLNLDNKDNAIMRELRTIKKAVGEKDKRLDYFITTIIFSSLFTLSSIGNIILFILFLKG